MLRVLFIDDDPSVHMILRFLLPKECQLISAACGKQGLMLSRKESPDVVLLDLGLPDVDGMTVLRELLGQANAPPVIIVSIHSDSRRIVEAVKIGAADYIVKPVTSKDVSSMIRIALHFRVRAGEQRDAAIATIVGESPGIAKVRQEILRFAVSTLPVLIVGETGTGKELVAEAIHRLSPRREGPFLPMNCGAIPDTLVETELFGSVSGAYTGATTRQGHFEQASGGTLFMDEIGEMNRSAQVKLLRVLEERHITRVGASRPIAVDVRVLSATNRSLKEDIERGQFRRDLYYRINALSVSVPPLRERTEDLPMLVRSFLPEDRITFAALEKLERHDWPGNVRELKNVVERARLYACGEPIGPRHISF
ncbi:MAG TPA: sigma-54 dependent transcriptional regulator [Spirochaetia bacterium]|nr:sigma-54 dependent transcriptional regulator [Spirochaetia bacterium]